MSAHDEHHDHETPRYQQHFFENMTQQSQSTLFGMWLFMAQEILFFGGLFGIYTAYRVWFQDAYIAGADTLDVGWGLVNTIVLLASSVTIVFAVKAARDEKRWAIVNWLMATLVLGLVFLGVKTLEYTGKYNHHLVPGNGSVLTMVGLDSKPFDFAYYQNWKVEDAILGGHDDHHEGVGRPRNFVKDAWFRYVRDEASVEIQEGSNTVTKTVPILHKKFRGKSDLEKFRDSLTETADPEKQKKNEKELKKKKKELQKDVDAVLATYEQARLAQAEGQPYNPAPYASDYSGFPQYIETYEEKGGKWEAKQKPVVPKGVELYFSLYFAMSGMHALHMIIGSFLLLWIAFLAAKGTFTKEYYPHVEYFGLYWHFVDIVWIFLFPLLYLI